MYSLDAVLWKGKRSEKEAAMKKAKQSAYGSALPRVAQDKKIKQIYGKTTKEMYESYLSRVDHWMQDAPAQNWTKEYDKETYSRAYVPRERQKEKDIGGPTVKIGSYSPRGVYKGGGKCVRQLVDPKVMDTNALPRELYKQRIINFEKTREKHKELHPPMAIPKNKPLTCGKYFVSDVICCSSQDDDRHEHGHGGSNQQHSSRCRKCAAHCCSSSSPEHQEEDLDEAIKEREDVATKHYFRHIHSRVGRGDDKGPQPTAEYVASPKWRVHDPHKWISRDFSTTIAPTNTHTATLVSISGMPYKPSLLIAERFSPTNRNVATATSPLVIAFVSSFSARARAKGQDRGGKRATIPTARAKEILQLDVDGSHSWTEISSTVYAASRNRHQSRRRVDLGDPTPSP
uniref:Uncharacterized protein n=1 Tax=Globisporangium ultimum (strain ATCC 200006 / CBS 805.95 / DAOM BR144) TaxID=431595 RepID=K3WDT6_GLOUD